MRFFHESTPCGSLINTVNIFLLGFKLFPETRTGKDTDRKKDRDTDRDKEGIETDQDLDRDRDRDMDRDGERDENREEDRDRGWGYRVGQGHFRGVSDPWKQLLNLNISVNLKLNS
jgi:hypothetical protein